MKKLTIVVVLVLAVLLCTPPLLGMRAHDQLQDSLARSAQQAGENVHMTLEDYHRGWFSSNGRIRITLSEAYVNSINAADSDSAVAEMLRTGIAQDVRVTHGPLIVGESTSVGLGELVSTLDAQSHPDLKRILAASGNSYLLRATLNLGFSGVGDIQLDAPAFRYTNGDNPPDTVVFAGGQARGNLDVQDMQIVMQGEVNGFSMTGADAEFLLEGIEFAADMRYPETDPYGLGTGRVSFDRALALGGQGSTLHMQNAAMAFSTGKDDAGRVKAEVSYTVQGFTSDGTELRDFELTMSMHNLEAGALARLQALSGVATDTAQIISQLQAPVYDLLSAGPVLSVTPFAFNFAGQPFNASLHVSTSPHKLPDRRAFDVTNPLLYASLFDIEADLAVHKQLAIQAAVPQIRAQLAAGVPAGASVDDAQLDAMAQAQAPMLLGTLLGQGMIIEEGDNYRLRASFSGGELRINGNPFPLGALLGAGLAGPGL